MIVLSFKANCLSIIQLGETCLILASMNDARDAVSVLLAAKADPNITKEVKLHYGHCLLCPQ